MKKLLSFVVPVYNEQENISLLYEKLLEVFAAHQHRYDFEVILVNDGSRDNSWNCIRQLAASDCRVKGICFSRNFGHQRALTAGYDKAVGDAVVSLDADLQHPTELLSEMIREWEQGYLVVYARRKKSHESFFKKASSFLYTYILNKISGFSFPAGVADFRLLDRQVVDTLSLCKDRFRYLRGAVFSLGYPAAFVDYEQPLRQQGTSKYTLSKMISLAFNGLLCFSTFPLRLAFYLGFVALLLGFFGVFYIFVKTYFLGHAFFLYGACFSVLYLLLGMIFIVVWILGEYIFRIYELEKGTPCYVVLQTTDKKEKNTVFCQKKKRK